MLSFEYDVDIKVRRPRTKYIDEQDLVREFNASRHTNVCLRYSTPEDARNAAQAITRYVKQTRTPILVRQRDAQLILVRKELKR